MPLVVMFYSEEMDVRLLVWGEMNVYSKVFAFVSKEPTFQRSTNCSYNNYPQKQLFQIVINPSTKKRRPSAMSQIEQPFLDERMRVMI